VKVIDHLIKSIRASANHNPEAEIKPDCILWTDKDRQWENAIKRIMPELPELLILGEYYPLERKGPAIWLRTVIGGFIEEYSLPYGRVPVLYLPGVSRQDLRAVEQCPDELKPLAELQYRGVIWSQVNARDWTILAYLKTKQGGIGLNVNQDVATLQAMQRAVIKLLDEDIENLKTDYLDKDYFNSLISGVDTVKDILLWLSDQEAFRAGRTNEEWQAFLEICKSKYKFNPEQDGIFAATEKFGGQDKSWQIVWDRFCEAPEKYQAIPDILRKTIMPLIGNRNRFPQWNEEQETVLRKELLKISGMTEQSAREEILRLENEHAERRKSVWAELGEAPLAIALEWISEIATKTSSVTVGDFAEVAKAQDKWGWQVDYAAISTLASVEKQEDIAAVISALRSLYLPWLDINARELQNAIKENGYPPVFESRAYKQGDCVCFIDGLRFDLSKRLSEIFKENGFDIQEEILWAPLPTVTATCKPALMSLEEEITGDDLNQDFIPIIRDNAQPATSAKLYNLMEDKGWSILADDKLALTDQKGWYEFGRIDEEGHKIGWRIASQVEKYLREVRERVQDLFKAGWKTVRIVSDHGWLLMPGGLPKISLPKSLTESKWGRCAVIKPGALYDGTLYPWFWNEGVNFGLADGVNCYRKGIEYTHGGISLQECLMLQLTLTEKNYGQIKSDLLITEIQWKGMRCKIAVDGDNKGVKADIRLKPMLPETSIVMNIKDINENGLGSLIVDEDSYEGRRAYIVLLDKNNSVICQSTTNVGGGDN